MCISTTAWHNGNDARETETPSAEKKDIWDWFVAILRTSDSVFFLPLSLVLIACLFHWLCTRSIDQGDNYSWLDTGAPLCKCANASRILLYFFSPTIFLLSLWQHCTPLTVNTPDRFVEFGGSPNQIASFFFALHKFTLIAADLRNDFLWIFFSWKFSSFIYFYFRM